MAKITNDPNNRYGFTDEAYQAYLNSPSGIHNEKLRGETESLKDVMLSDDADVTKAPGGKDFLAFIYNEWGV